MRIEPIVWHGRECFGVEVAEYSIRRHDKELFTILVDVFIDGRKYAFTAVTNTFEDAERVMWDSIEIILMHGGDVPVDDIPGRVELWR
jgi:hypothetical protein